MLLASKLQELSHLARLFLPLKKILQSLLDLFLQNLVKGTSHLSLSQEAIAAAERIAELIKRYRAAFPRDYEIWRARNGRPPAD